MWLRGSVQACDLFEWEFRDKKIYMLQKPELHKTVAGHVGGTVWDCAIVFSKYLEKNADEFQFKNKSVLELGAGLGLPGILIGLMEGNVLLTEQAPVLEILQKNVNNGHKFSGNVSVQELNWGDMETMQKVKKIGPFDFIIGSDVVYLWAEVIDLLITTLLFLATEKTVILLAFEVRNALVKKFVENASQFFNTFQEPPKKLDPVFQVDDIFIVRLTKRID